jgi:transcription antitermination factor NusG
MLSAPRPSWYVLHTRSRFESVVNDGLEKKHIEVFLPKVTVKSRRKDRHLMIKVPLFSGYLFVKTDLNPPEHVEILRTIGSVRLIGNKQGPIAVPDETVESLKIMVGADLPIGTGNKLRKGERVMVIAGPLAGVIGTFVRYKGKGRVVVNIEALGQFAAVEVDLQDVERMPDILL